uniref:Uncharacterized protein n=1 Tax=Glossina pallidipes TaxID=7398 RepID=A0A1B0AGU0_GLOPL
MGKKFGRSTSSAVEVLKNQIDLEKSTLKYHELSKIPEEIIEEEEQEVHFQSLVNELSVARGESEVHKFLHFLRSDLDDWRIAMKSEYTSLLENKTLNIETGMKP